MSSRAVSADLFAEVVDVDGKRHSSEWGFVPPAEATTDYAIAAHREFEPEKLIVHYMQPHQPYIAPAMSQGREMTDLHRNPFETLKSTSSFDDVWNAYVDNLRYVLDDVRRLLENIDADTVIISSDHGELFGEWGLYSHHVGIPHPDLRQVPWVETSATDERTTVPKVDLSASVDERTTEFLEALGYG